MAEKKAEEQFDAQKAISELTKVVTDLGGKFEQLMKFSEGTTKNLTTLQSTVQEIGKRQFSESPVAKSKRVQEVVDVNQLTDLLYSDPGKFVEGITSLVSSVPASNDSYITPEIAQKMIDAKVDQIINLQRINESVMRLPGMDNPNSSIYKEISKVLSENESANPAELQSKIGNTLLTAMPKFIEDTKNEAVNLARQNPGAIFIEGKSQPGSESMKYELPVGGKEFAEMAGITAEDIENTMKRKQDNSSDIAIAREFLR